MLISLCLMTDCKRPSQIDKNTINYLPSKDSISWILCDNNQDTIINGKVYYGQRIVQRNINDYLQTNKNDKNIFHTKLINDPKILISVIEPILYNIYGEEQIKKQRPYGIYKLGDFWYVIGSLKAGMDGGTFHIGIDSRNCAIISIFHEK